MSDFRLKIGNEDASNCPIVQDPQGIYYTYSNGMYYEPIYKDFYNTLPTNVTMHTDGSHSHASYYNGVKQTPWDIYCVAWSEFKLGGDFKITFIYGDYNTPDGYFVGQFVDSSNIQYLFGHSYTEAKQWDIIGQGNVVGKSNPSMGHLHITAFDGNKPIDIAKYIFTNPDPTPPTECEKEIEKLNKQLEEKDVIIESLNTRLDKIHDLSGE